MFYKVHYGESAILEVEECWKAFQHHPNSDCEHFLLVCKLRKEVISPWAFSIWKDAKCQAIIAGRIEEIILRPAIGYAELPGIKAKALFLIHEGILGEVDEDGSEALLETLIDLLRSGNIDVVSFHHLSEKQSAIWASLKKRERMAIGVSNPRWSTHHALKLEKKPGFLLEKMRSKHRSWIKRKEKELYEAFKGDVKWVWHSRFSDIGSICEKMETVAKTTYQRGLGAGFIDNHENRQRLLLFASKNQLRVMLLEVEGRPASFWYGVVYNGTFHASATGYLPDMEEHEVGRLTLLKTIDELVREGVEGLDFGLGDAYYKERFSNTSWREATVQIFAPTARGRILKNYIALSGWIDKQLRKLAGRIGRIDRIKKKWRTAIRKKAN